MTAWTTYGELARRLDEANAAEAERVAGQREAVQRVRAALDDLDERLDTRAEELSSVAYKLRFGHPRLAPAAPTPVASLEDGLRRATSATDEAARELRRAEEQAYLPTLLPHWKPWARNAAIYAAWALAGMLAQWTMILLAPDKGGSDLFTVVAWSLCGFPAIAFFGGYITTGLIGKPRLDEPPDKHATRTQSTSTPRNPRLGALICFAALPVSWALVTLIKTMFTHR